MEFLGELSKVNIKTGKILVYDLEKWQHYNREEYKSPRYNFDTYINSMLVIFISMSETWIDIM